MASRNSQIVKQSRISRIFGAGKLSTDSLPVRLLPLRFPANSVTNHRLQSSNFELRSSKLEVGTARRTNAKGFEPTVPHLFLYWESGSIYPGVELSLLNILFTKMSTVAMSICIWAGTFRGQCRWEWSELLEESCFFESITSGKANQFVGVKTERCSNTCLLKSSRQLVWHCKIFSTLIDSFDSKALDVDADSIERSILVPDTIPRSLSTVNFHK
jgi:hypothetical protein